MARPRTSIRVHEAVFQLVSESGYASLTMEGIAARAKVSKQTLYRSWPSTGAILFDALLTRDANPSGGIDLPDSGDLAADLQALVDAIILELTDPANDRLFRAVTAEIQSDPDLATQLRQRLLDPQVKAISDRLRRSGVDRPDEAAELLLGPIFHRWLLRTAPFERGWARAHVGRVVRAVG